MLFEAALAALLLGLLCGGRPRNLLDFKLRGLVLLLISVAASILPRLPVVGAALAGLGAAGAVAFAVVRYGLLVAFALLNRRCIPVDVIGLGGFSNFLVTAANGGTMPVSPAVLNFTGKNPDLLLIEQGRVLNYTLANAGTRLPFLGDIFAVRGFYIYYLSVGDAIIAAGIFALILTLMKPVRPAFAGRAAKR